MNPFKICFLTLALCSVAYAQNSNYQDQPVKAAVKDIAPILQPYSEQAKKALPHFDSELQKPKGRTFFIITKLYQGAVFEQIFVKVKSKEEDGYHGTIASKPMGRVKFKNGAAFVVSEKDVVDWCIVKTDGTEEGNLTGKALDALGAKILSFVIEMKPQNGVFSQFRVASVLNPRTQQGVRELVPAEVIGRVEKEAAKQWSGVKADGDKVKYQFILVSFPSWELVKK